MSTLAFTLAGIPLFAAPDYTGTSGSGGFEVPADLEFGLETWGSVHRIPTTGTAAPKIIAQTFGVFPTPIKWEAWWLGTQAESRARMIAGVHQQQAVVRFTAGYRAYDVIIWNYREKVHSRFEIAYEIELRPIADRSGRVPYGPTPASAPYALTGNYLALQSLASSAPADARLNGLDTSLAGCLAAIQAAQPEPSQTTPTLLSLTGTCNATLALAQGIQTTLQGSSAPFDTASYLWAGQVVGTLQAYIGTLGEYTAGNQDLQVLVGAGTDLMTVAATQLGDWTRFTDLMTINGLTDPFLTATMMISLPAS